MVYQEVRNILLMAVQKFVEGKVIERFNNWREVTVIAVDRHRFNRIWGGGGAQGIDFVSAANFLKMQNR